MSFLAAKNHLLGQRRQSVSAEIEMPALREEEEERRRNLRCKSVKPERDVLSVPTYPFGEWEGECSLDHVRQVRSL